MRGNTKDGCVGVVTAQPVIRANSQITGGNCIQLDFPENRLSLRECDFPNISQKTSFYTVASRSLQVIPASQSRERESLSSEKGRMELEGMEGPSLHRTALAF